MNAHRRFAPTLEQLELDELEAAFLGPLTNRRKAREWSLVLASQDIVGTPQFSVDGWLVRIPRASRAKAVETIELYERENVGWPPKRKRDLPRYPVSVLVPAAFLALAVFYYVATGPVSSGSYWFVEGRADAVLLSSEPWRMVTALTLHADSQHLLGNLISGSIFGALVSRRLGAGGALLAVVAAGGLGNALNAIYHLSEGHRSIGASTAVFGAVGLLAGIQTIVGLRRQEKRSWALSDLVAPAIGGLALLGTFGADPNSDVSAHGFGFAAGLGLGLMAASVMDMRRFPSQGLRQWLPGAVAVAVVVGSWALALGG